MLRSKLAAWTFAVLAALGLAAAGAATATPASAATWNDTSLQVNFLHGTCPTVPGDVLTHSPAGTTITVTPHQVVSPPSHGTIAVHGDLPAGVTQSGPTANGTLTFTGISTSNGSFSVTEQYASNCVAALPVTVAAGVLTPGTRDDGPVSFGRSYVSDGVQFSTNGGTGSSSFGFSNPAGIVGFASGLLSVSQSSAAPGTYGSRTVTATDDLGAMAEGVYQLVVQAQEVPVVVPPGDLGDFVNAYGNGLDVFGQHYAAGSIVAGWTATQSDPATLWIRHDTGLTIGGNTVYSIEATRSGGHATGLCVSNPMGGWSDPAGPTGLLIVHCAGNPQANKFQQFYLDGGTHHLISVINGQAVSPHGTGAQLTASGVAPWPGGSDYRWMDKASLPG